MNLAYFGQPEQALERHEVMPTYLITTNYFLIALITYLIALITSMVSRNLKVL